MAKVTINTGNNTSDRAGDTMPAHINNRTIKELIMKKKQIIVADAGWVLIGEIEDIKTGIIIHDANVIRVWGTTAGLGEIAIKGVTSSTVLDFAGEVHINTPRILMRIPCKV
jgi:hypothetical protein